MLPDTIAPVIKVMMDLEPRQILDLNPGAGKFGVMAREYIEGVDVDAISDMETPIHKAIYTHLYHANPQVMLWETFNYDLYLAVDMLGTWRRNIGHIFLQKLKAPVLITIPKAPHIDNPEEWSIEDFEDYVYEDHSTPLTMILLLKSVALGVDRASI